MGSQPQLSHSKLEVLSDLANLAVKSSHPKPKLEASNAASFPPPALPQQHELMTSKLICNLFQ